MGILAVFQKRLVNSLRKVMDDADGAQKISRDLGEHIRSCVQEA